MDQQNLEQKCWLIDQRALKKPTVRPEKTARREVNIIWFCQFLYLHPRLFYVLMQSSRLAISHEQEHFPTLTGEGSKAGWTQIELQNF